MLIYNLKLFSGIIIDRIRYSSRDQSVAAAVSCRTEISLSFNIRLRESRDFSRFFPASCHVARGFEGAFGFLGDHRERKTEPHGVYRLAPSLSRPGHLFVFHIDRVLIQPCTVGASPFAGPCRAPLNPRRTPPVNHRDGPTIPQRNVNEDAVCYHSSRVTCLLCSALLRLVNGRRKRFAQTHSF